MFFQVVEYVNCCVPVGKVTPQTFAPWQFESGFAPGIILKTLLRSLGILRMLHPDANLGAQVSNISKSTAFIRKV